MHSKYIHEFPISPLVIIIHTHRIYHTCFSLVPRLGDEATHAHTVQLHLHYALNGGLELVSMDTFLPLGDYWMHIQPIGEILYSGCQTNISQICHCSIYICCMMLKQASVNAIIFSLQMCWWLLYSSSSTANIYIAQRNWCHAITGYGNNLAICV